MKKLEDFNKVFFSTDFKFITNIFEYNDCVIAIYNYQNDFYMLKTIISDELHNINKKSIYIVLKLNNELLKDYLLQKISEKNLLQICEKIILIKALFNNKRNKFEFYKINFEEFMFLYGDDYTELDLLYCHKQYSENEISELLKGYI